MPRNGVLLSGQAGVQIYMVSGASGTPDLADLEYQATSFGATPNARYMKHILPIFVLVIST
jgi:hypothetical protein